MKFLLLFIFIAALCFGVAAQGGGSVTAEPKVYTSRRTVGIIDPKASVVYKNVTPDTPFKDFTCVSGGKDKEFILETTACVVAVFDFDNDQRPDVFLLNGSTINAELGREKAPKSALYRNLGDWKFEDVTEKAGVANERWGMGVTVGDYNNDGFADLFVSNYGVSRLYKNNGDGTFTDVAPKVGLDARNWHTGATFGDFNKDGRLDLFVPAYVDFDLKNLPQSPLDVEKGKGVGRNFCQFRGQPVMCGPRGLKGAKDALYQQKADGTFENVSQSSGVVDDGNYYGFSSVFVDIDDDDDLDLLVVNDSTPKQLYLNNGNGKFEEIGQPSGIALSENGREQAGMGLGVGDYDNDGRVDFHITNFSDDSNTLYRNDGDANFTDITFQAGLGEPSIPFLGWGTGFLDFDNDGWKDVIVANGHVYPVVDKFQWGTSFAQQMLLFRNLRPAAGGKLSFERVAAAPASGLADATCARGMATADFDGDGKIDVIVSNMDAAPTLLRNVSADKNNWLGVRVNGSSASGMPRDLIGTKVFVTTGKLRQRADLYSGAGYASQSEQILRFGLGTATKVDALEVVWPNGRREKITVEPINQVISISPAPVVGK